MQPFFIWFQQRSGSSHLVSLLNSHPEIQCKGEIFGCFPVADRVQQSSFPDCRVLGDKLYRRLINRFPGREEDPSDAQCVAEVERLFADEDQKLKPTCRGFKIKFPSQAKLFPEVLQALLQRREFLRVVVLSRKNYLQRAISVMNLERLQRTTNKSNVGEEISLPPTDFDVNEVLRLIRYYQEIEPEFCTWPRQFENCLDVEYDELIGKQYKCEQRIQQFLGIEQSRPLHSKLKKIAPTRISDLVQNVDELRSALREHDVAFDLE